MTDAVNHPQHYGTVPGVECIDVVEHLNFNRGNAIKYVWRAGSKGDAAKAVEDLRKAAWYCNREADRLQREIDRAAFRDVMLDPRSPGRVTPDTTGSTDHAATEGKPA